MSVNQMARTAGKALNANATAMATNSHNLANAEVEGASKQRVRFETSPAIRVGRHNIGAGSMIGNIERMNNEFVTKSVVGQAGNHGFAEERAFQLNELEKVYSVAGDQGIGTLLTSFFNKFRQLSNEPDNPAMRETVRASADTLIKSIRETFGRIEQAQYNLQLKVVSNVDKLNSQIKNISEVTKDIHSLKIKGGNANDLEDQRDAILENIAKTTGARYRIDKDDNVTIEMNGIPLLVGVEEFHMESKMGADGVKIYSRKNVNPDITDFFEKGTLGGLVKTEKNELIEMKNYLDTVSYNLANAVNAIHTKGYGLNGQTGVNFFEVPQEVTMCARDLKLSKEVKSDSNFVAAGLGPNAPGDNRIALAIARLQDYKLMDQGTKTLDDFLNGHVANLGVQMGRAEVDFEQNQMLTDQIHNLRESMSGISADEEMQELIKHQKAYDAAAKVIQVSDQLFQSVLNIVGR